MQRCLAILIAAVAMSGCIEMWQEELSTDQGRVSKASPTVGWANDEASDRTVVMHVQADVRWENLTITGDRPAYFRLNDGAIRQFSPTRETTIGMGDVAGGDKLDFCLPEGGGLETRIVYAPDNVILHVYTFYSVTEHKWCG